MPELYPAAPHQADGPIAGAVADKIIETIEAKVQGDTVVVPFGNETRSIRHRVVTYCNGLGLDLGCGGEKIVHTAIGIDVNQAESAANIKMDFGDLKIFASEAFDFVYCVPPNRLVLSEHGWEEIGKIKKGDYVVGRSGLVRVTDSFRLKNKFGRLARIKTPYGFTECTENHPVASPLGWVYPGKLRKSSKLLYCSPEVQPSDSVDCRDVRRYVSSLSSLTPFASSHIPEGDSPFAVSQNNFSLFLLAAEMWNKFRKNAGKFPVASADGCSISYFASKACSGFWSPDITATRGGFSFRENHFAFSQNSLVGIGNLDCGQQCVPGLRGRHGDPERTFPINNSSKISPIVSRNVHSMSYYDAIDDVVNLETEDGTFFLDGMLTHNSSHAIEDTYYTDPCLREWWRVIKPNGYLVLAWPDWSKYDDSKASGEWNPDHMGHPEPKDFKRIMGRFAHAEIVKEESFDRSSILVFRKLSRALKGEIVKRPRPKPDKACLLVRYGAFGDAVIVTPVLRELKRDGYHVSLNCSDYANIVFKNNPHIDSVILHQRDSVPLDDLTNYWKYLASPYDRYVNLSGSIEGSMLVLEDTSPQGCVRHKKAYEIGCEQCATFKEVRDRNHQENYYDRTMALSGYPALTGQRGELYFSYGEIFKAKHLHSKHRRKNQFIIIWSLSGSSFHKSYPYWYTVAIEFCKRHSDVLIYTVGDAVAGVAEMRGHPQINPRCEGNRPSWSIRESMLMTHFADAVIGGETGVMHAAAADCFDQKGLALGKQPNIIVFLSHSSANNLTKYWPRTTALEPEAKQAPCFPCHQLHYSKESCPLKPFPLFLYNNFEDPPDVAAPPEDKSTMWPVCMSHGISPQRVFNTLEAVYKERRNG